MLGYALRRTDNTDDAADVLAETFLVAWRRPDEIPPGPQARLWLYGTARRVLANQRRAERRRLTGGGSPRLTVATVLAMLARRGVTVRNGESSARTAA